MVNYNFEILFEEGIADFKECFPDMTTGELIYSVLRQLKPAGKGTISWLLEVSDEDIYDALGMALKEELED